MRLRAALRRNGRRSNTTKPRDEALFDALAADVYVAVVRASATGLPDIRRRFSSSANRAPGPR